MARKFGIITDLTGLQAGIVVNGLTRNESSETAEARNDKGKVTDLAAYSRGVTLSLSGVMDVTEGTELAKAGNKLTIDGTDYLIESVDVTESNTDFVQVSINAKTADQATIHVIVEDVVTP